jgi:hypothetical protein
MRFVACMRSRQDIGDTNSINWQRFVRRAEALYALVAQHKGNETGVAGVDWASRVLENSNGTEIDFAAAAEPGSTDYYLKQAWGAYGAAYASQLYEIGIFAEATTTLSLSADAIAWSPLRVLNSLSVR